MAATTLSIFVVPMTEHFGWSRGVFSGALSLGGLCAVVISPFVGRWIDRYGSGVVLSATAAIIGLCGVGLAFVSHLWVFYA
ncbi:MAG: MFS transporter, partial [Chloroflexi bacterium]|nr:MFS transporter [Chloroflexota bacterium]